MSLLKVLRALEIESHLVMTQSAAVTMKAELETTVSDLWSHASVVHNIKDIGAAIASGSFRTMGMIVAPCSMRTMANIANGNTDNLLTRAAEVVLKERRRLVLLVRETPFHLGHLRNMVSLTEMGAVIMPPIPAFYSKPKTIADIVDHSVGRALDLFDIDSGIVKRWKENAEQDPHLVGTNHE